MLRRTHVYPRIGVPLTFALLLLFILAPSALANTQHGQPSKRHVHHSLVGPKGHYLALGDSLAFGFQPDLNFDDGYVDDFYSNLRGHGVHSLANMACPGETSSTFLNGKCPYPYLRKFPYLGSQLNAAVDYLRFFSGSVSPVTLDIGANDVKGDINTKTCVINQAQLQVDLATLDNNLRNTILPQLQAALTVNGQVSGDILVMNYYDPYQNICPNSVPLTQAINQHLASDVQGYATLVDVFSAFGGTTTPNPNICTYTWMCSFFHDIHATDRGYSVIAATFESRYGY